MKKICSLLLSAVMFVTLAVSFAAPVNAEADFFERFKGLNVYVMETVYTKSDFNVNILATWVYYQYRDTYEWTVGDYGEDGVFTENEKGYDYALSADKFEAAAHQLFDFDGTCKELIASNKMSYSELIYDEGNDRFIYASRGKGGMGLRQRGYIEMPDGSYNVYIQGMDMYTTDGDMYPYWSDTCYLLNVRFVDGEHLKTALLSSSAVLPSEGLITPSDIANINYILADGIGIGCETALPDGSTVTVKRLFGSDMNAVKEALGDKAGKRMMVYTVSAELNGESLQPAEDVTMTVSLPGDFSSDTVKFYRIGANGEVSELPIASFNDPGKIGVKLNSFETYALCDSSDAAVTSPQTDDTAPAIIAVIALSTLIVCAAVLVGRKDDVA